ncbi:hypothetical protein CgunFtcFv8_018043 [Champsocephalus gunnari]|uniref:phytanoyl-CoA dioxygenase n=1 Tax=Champsocephalus gunnari TaxID=52237 RepID=A0AAN8HRK2_CHAGU|nr:hypothetical protein CgunFtcFv8_017777 [Champsocephalus gunnari]KAK5925527.1 hypothetical protein CgunFtcFv8_018043 [Champsocephalus gunnari]
MTSSTNKLQEVYNQLGFLSALPVLNQTQLREAKRAFSELEEEFGEEYTQYSLHNVHLQYPWVRDLTQHPQIIQVVKAILGPDVILLDSRFICKYPTLKPDAQDNEGGRNDELPYVAWHQDMRYWGIAGGPVLSVWLALDDSLQENGALQLIPGSHCAGMLPHRQATRPGNMLSLARCLFMMDHASDANTSQRRRCGLVIRYIPTCAHPTQDPDRPRKFAATMLACGSDRFNNFSDKTT